MSLIRVLFSKSYDPWFNLSVENYIYYHMIQYKWILFLWRNHDTVVIGRAQNPWKECNTRRMKRDKIRLARRNSGGGAVFHDLGNTCFTFISRKNKIDKNNNFSVNIVLKSLKHLGINAFIDGRNDIIVHTNLGKRKVSGSAYRYTRKGKLHHGTLLLNSNLNKLVYYLTPDEKKLESKGITSIRSRVTNLINLRPNINHEILCNTLQETFFDSLNQRVTSEIISPDVFLHNPDFSKIFLKQSSWKWNFGTIPNFTHHLFKRFTFGDISLYFDIKDGMINRIRIFTDSLYPEPLEELPCKLINSVYEVTNIESRCQVWVEKWSRYPELLEVSEWLIESIS